MPNCYLTKRWGETIQNPQLNDLVSALHELETSDPEHPDCWLNTEEGWSISLFEGKAGLVTFQNIETGEGPWHMRSISKTEALKLWQLLQQDDLAALKAKPWAEGYGNT